MTELRVPSLQHLARNWEAKSDKIAGALVRLVENPPIFSYDPLYSAIRDRLLLNVPYDQIEEGIRRIKRSDVRENLLGVLPLIQRYFDGVSPSFVQSVERRYYSVGRGLMVPFSPPLIYGIEGKIHFPWFSFWRSNPLADKRLSLFVTLVDDILRDDPDLEDAVFSILDFSAAAPKMPRALKVINASDIPRVSDAEKKSMLSIFADGFHLAKVELASTKKSATRSDDRRETEGEGPDLFDPDF